MALLQRRCAAERRAAAARSAVQSAARTRRHLHGGTGTCTQRRRSHDHQQRTQHGAAPLIINAFCEDTNRTEAFGNYQEKPLLTMMNESVQSLGSLATRGNVSVVLPAVNGSAPREADLLKHSIPMVVFFSAAYSIVFILAVINNSLILAVIYRNPQMRTVTNYFLANLAAADILVSLINLPITLLSNIFTDWLFGPFLCKATPYLQAVAVSASVNTLAAVAVERYFAIFYSHTTIISPNAAMIIISVIWLVPVCIQIPWALYFQEIRISRPLVSRTYCAGRWISDAFERGFFLGVVFLTCYLIPLCFICICYSLIGLKVWKRNVAGIRGSQAERNIQRTKIRILRMLITVAVTFTFAWLPLYSLRLRYLFGPPIGPTERWVVFGIVQPIAQWMGSATSAVNPFIYCYFSESFRKSILAVLRSRSCCSKITADSIAHA